MAALTAIHLCSGYGGFELALRRLARVRTVAHVERDAYAAAVLVERMGQARLDQAPIWDDLHTFDGRPWRGRVDIITAGFPCQPFSSAGRQRGTDDARWLWPSIRRVISDVGPRFVLLENVPDVVRLGLSHIAADLAELGFDAEWGLLAASDVGAPHRRVRFWLVAHAESTRLPRRRARTPRRRTPTGTRGDAERHRRRHLADTDRDGFGRFRRGRQPVERDTDRRDTPIADLGHTRRPRRSEIPRRAPGDERPHGWQPHRRDIADRASQRLADPESIRSAPRDRPGTRHRGTVTEERHRWPPRRGDERGWAEWIAAGGPQPVVRRDADGAPDGLADALHLGGNGLVPQAAAHAIRQLLDRAGWELT